MSAMLILLKEDPLISPASLRSLYIIIQIYIVPSSLTRKGMEFKPFHATYASFNRSLSRESHHEICAQLRQPVAPGTNPGIRGEPHILTRGKYYGRDRNSEVI